MAKVALVETKPSRTDYRKEFEGAFDFDQYQLCSDPTIKATEAGRLKNILSSSALFCSKRILFFFFKKTCFESCGRTTTPIAIPAIARFI